MAISETTTILELASLVAEKLRAKGLSPLLVGGAVVSIYTENRYESGDLDFVIEQFVVRRGLIDEAMEELDFSKEKSRVYLHPRCRFAVDFSPPPAAIGNELIREPTEIPAPHGRVRLLTPTQSVMDRLSAYYHFDDRQGLEQAVLVAEAHPIHLKMIQDWSEREGMREKLKDFEARIRTASEASRR